VSHDHHHHAGHYNKAFAIGVGLNLAYVAVEAGFGLKADSLALLADAGHNLSDVLGLGVSWAAHCVSQSPPTHRRTYGWRSTSILAALVNALLLVAAVGGIVWEAARRFYYPEPAAGSTMVWVALAGVIVNGATAWLFHAGRKHDLNIKGAFLHMAADAGVSLGVVVAGLAIQATGSMWIDPLVSLIVAAVIFASTWGLLKSSINLSLHAVPEGIDFHEVRDWLGTLAGVVEVHDLHIWAMSTTEVALTAHLVKPALGNEDALFARASAELHARFGIDHVTLQIERGGAEATCHQAPENVV
jgi:cobalt-zinc-cadmium efflux system protein